MKIHFISITLLVLFLISCSSDDNDATNNSEEISYQQQNAIDDAAILLFLQSRYFGEDGFLRTYDPNDPSDDNYASLADLNPYFTTSGNVYVKNPYITFDNTEWMGDNHFKYQFTSFKATFDSQSQFYSFTDYRDIDEDLSGTVYPLFYRLDPAISYPNDPSYYLMPGFQEVANSIPALNPPNHDAGKMVAVAIIPSRNNYGRANNYYGLYREVAVILFAKYKQGL